MPCVRTVPMNNPEIIRAHTHKKKRNTPAGIEKRPTGQRAVM